MLNLTSRKFWSDSSISAIRTTLITLGAIVGSGGLALFADAEVNKWIGYGTVLLNALWIVYSNAKTQDEQVSAIQVGQQLGLEQALPLKPSAALPQVMSEKEITSKLNTGAIQVPTSPKKEPTP